MGITVASLSPPQRSENHKVFGVSNSALFSRRVLVSSFCPYGDATTG